MMMNRDIKVFIASSNELAEERLMIGAWANEFDNNIEANGNFRLRLKIWEDFDNRYDGRRTQDHYNEELIEDSDIFIVLIRKKCGDRTVEEIEYSTKYDIRHRLAIFIPDGITAVLSDEWKTVLSSNSIKCVVAQSQEDMLSAIKGIIEDVIANRHLPKEYKPLHGTLVYATVSDDLPCGENRVRNIVRRMDAYGEKMYKPRLYLFPYHKKEEIERSHHYYGFVGSSADDTAESEISTALRKACRTWQPTLYVKDFESFRQTSLGKYVCDDCDYYAPPLDDAYRCFEYNLRNVLDSQEIRLSIYKDIEILNDRAFLADFEIEDYSKLVNADSLMAELKDRRRRDEKNLIVEETEFYDDLIKARIKTVLSVRLQLKTLILEEIRYFGYIHISARLEDFIRRDNVEKWLDNSARAIELLDSLDYELENDDEQAIHLWRLKALFALWQSESIPTDIVKKIIGNAKSEYEDAQLLLLSLHFRDTNYDAQKNATFKALKFFFSKASDDTDRCYNLQCGLDAIEPLINETETDDVVRWLDYLKSYYGSINVRSVRLDLLYCRLITAYIRRLPDEEDSTELIEELRTIADRLWLDNKDLLPENLEDMSYALNIIGAYYADRLDHIDSAAASAKRYLSRAYELITKFNEIDRAEAAPLLAMVSHNLGWLHCNLGDNSEACEYYKTAYKTRKLIQRVELLTNADFLVAETAVNYASVLLDLHHIEEALSKATEALTLRQNYKNIPEENHQADYMIALQIYGTVLLRIPFRRRDGISALVEVYQWALAHPHSKRYGYFMSHAGELLHILGVV